MTNMLTTVDWASLFVLASALAAVFIAGIQVGIRYERLRQARIDRGA